MVVSYGLGPGPGETPDISGQIASYSQVACYGVALNIRYRNRTATGLVRCGQTDARIFVKYLQIGTIVGRASTGRNRQGCNPGSVSPGSNPGSAAPQMPQFAGRFRFIRSTESSRTPANPRRVVVKIVPDDTQTRDRLIRRPNRAVLCLDCRQCERARRVLLRLKDWFH